MHEEEDKDVAAMPQKCAVAACINRSDNRERWVVMPHVTDLSFHSCPDPELLEIWTQLLSHGHIKPKVLHGHTCVCSNHFPRGRPFLSSPLPTLYLRGYDDEEDNYVAARILRDTMNTDHDYPKLRYCEEEEKLDDMLTVSCVEEVEEKIVKPPSEDTVSTRSRCVKDSAHRQKEIKTIKSSSDGLSTRSAKRGVTAEKEEKEELFATRISQQKYAPVLSVDSVDSTENSAAMKDSRRFRARKRRYSRDTDHMYNSRKSESVKHSLAKMPRDRSTDHLYDCRKVDSVDSSCVQTPSNRDTDHMYNMPRAKVNELINSTSVAQVSDSKCTARDDPESSAIVDKRVVDKDHMYQHRVRKNRNKVDSRSVETRSSQCHPGASTKKVSKLERNDAEDRSDSDHTKKQVTKCENSVLPSKEAVTDTASGGHAYITRHGGKPSKRVVKKQRRRAALKNCPSVEDTASPCDKSAISTNVVAASPIHSDTELDHVCDEDSLQTGVWHSDHMYVHLNTDILERKEPPVMTPCFSIEGYKQEHSYANSEEVHYNACVNCSQLVQQLIGTIRQQGDRIDKLKKKLHAANARNKQLASLYNQVCQSLE